MNVPNHEKKPFREMTAEERSAIVEAWIDRKADVISFNGWESAGLVIYAGHAYRTRPRQLIIPWEVIKPEYKWAAMDSDGEVYVFKKKPAIDHRDWYHDEYGNIYALNIDTTGIDWRESLVQRPDGV